MFIKDKNICMGCMKILQPDEKCSCEFDEEQYNKKPHWLPLGTILNDNLVVGRVLGEGGFGITYVGLDINIEMKVAIKEFYLGGSCGRDAEFTREIFSNGSQFYKFKNKFVDEAKILNQLKDNPNVVSVNRFFEENNTAYIVMEFIDGLTLKDYIKIKKRLTFKETTKIMRPIVNSLGKIHEQNMFHRDISPDNIIIMDNQKPVLIDFGSARKLLSNEQKTTGMVKMGYSPYEMFHGGVIGAYTDIFSLCATMYTCLTGEVPPNYEGDEYIDYKKLESTLKQYCDEEVIELIKKGMSIHPEDRFQDMSELASAINKILIPTSLVCNRCGRNLKPNARFCPKCGEPTPGNEFVKDESSSKEHQSSKNQRRNDSSAGDGKMKMVYVTAALVCVAVVVGIWFFLTNAKSSAGGQTITEATLTPVPAEAEPENVDPDLGAAVNGYSGEVAEVPENLEDIYADKLEAVKEKTPNAMFGLVDLDGDDVLELFYSSGDGKDASLAFCTVRDNELVELGSVSSYMGCYVYPGNNHLTVIANTEDNENVHYYSIDDGRIEQKKSFSSTSYENNNGEKYYIYLVDGNTIDRQNYTSRKGEYQKELRQYNGAGSIYKVTKHAVNQFDSAYFKSNFESFNITPEIKVNEYFDYNIEYPGDKTVGDDETITILNKLMANSEINPESVLMVDVGNYDTSSRGYGAFAFTGTVNEDNNYEGTLWYLSELSSPVCVEENLVCSEFDGRFATANKDLFKYVNVIAKEGANPVSCIWSIKDGQIEASKLSGYGTLAFADGKEDVTEFVINVATKGGKYNGKWEGEGSVLPYYCYVNDKGELKSRVANTNHSTLTLNSDLGFDILKALGIYVDAAGVEHNDRAVYRIVDWGNGIWSIHTYRYVGGYKYFEIINWDNKNKEYLNFKGMGEPNINVSILEGIYKNSITDKNYPVDVNSI